LVQARPFKSDTEPYPACLVARGYSLTMRRNEAATEGQSLLVNQILEKSINKQSDYGSALAATKGSEKESKDPEHQLFLQDGRRLHCLDVARIVCVGLVAVNHGGTKWSDQFGLWNQMYVQQWVLQWLFIICGMSFGMSSRGTGGYLARLMLYFVIGVCTNWCAWAIAGKDWKDNFWNVIFQFWFIFGLMLYIICLTPLKLYLKKLSQRNELDGMPPIRDVGLPNGLLIMASILFLIHFSFQYAVAPLMNWSLGHAIVEFQKSWGNGAQFWGMPGSSQDTLLFMQELLSYLQVSVGSLLILLIFPMVSNRLTLTNWLVILNVYTFRCFSTRGQFARIVDGFDFTMIGLANFHLGLSYRRTIGKYMCRYWFLVLFVFALLIPPGTWGRFDETTIESFDFRIRYHLVELAMMLLFLCAAERIADGGIFAEDKLEWLSWWALYVFLCHEAVHIVVPHPYNWAVLLSIAPIAWYFHGRSDSSQGQSQEAGPSPAEKQKQTDIEEALEGEKDTEEDLLLMDPDCKQSCPGLPVSQIEGR